MRNTLAALGAALAFGAAATAAPASAHDGHDPAATPNADLLPDLVTVPPQDVKLELRGRKRLLRMSNEILNRGQGPLELQVRPNDCNDNGSRRDDRTAFQRIYQDVDGDGMYSPADTAFRERASACTRFHPSHDHWHFDAFSRYDVKLMRRGRTVRTSDKVSFCVVDLSGPFSDVRGAPAEGKYFDCGADGTQGLSVGWSDIYDSDLPGQFVNVTGVPRGTYCLVSKADPMNTIVESAERNNAASVSVTIGKRRAVARRGVPC